MNVETSAAAADTSRASPIGDAQRSLDVNVDMVRCLLPEFGQVSITVVDSTETLLTCAQAGDLVADLDRLQRDFGEGPLSTASATRSRWWRRTSSATSAGAATSRPRQVSV